MTVRVDQLLSGFAEDDAISKDAVLMQAAFRAMGFVSDLFVPGARTDPAAAHRVRPLEQYEGSAGDVVLLHDVLEPEAAAFFRASPARRVLRYHNITPAEFFDPFDAALAARLRRARETLGRIASEADAVWAVSAFNAAELAEKAPPLCRVLPLLFDESHFRTGCEAAVMERYGGPLDNILFVGRLAPNKCVEELILAFHHYHRTINPWSRLIVAGSERSCPAYLAMLRLLAKALDLPNVCFEGFVSPGGLSALYNRARLFVTLSRHEGYCLPLVEAMAHEVPVIARRTGGMPEAMEEAGLLVEDLSAPVMGELMGEALHNPVVRGEMLQSQARRMETIRARDAAAELTRLLAEL